MLDPRSEFAYIEWLRSQVASHPAVTLGIGDDAAVVRIPPPGDCLVTVDMLMEGVDFRLTETGPREIGRKALAVNLSDIAAMAGEPLAAVVSVAFSRRSGQAFAEQLHAGLQELALEFNVAIAGGDTNVWDAPLVVSVTLLGRPTGTGPVRRSGARAGDWLMVTGELGGSIGGKHLSFQPRVREAMALHQSVTLHAMIDISDGLAADLHHILDESGAGAVLDPDAIPISDAARNFADGKTALEHALEDGEDFELLFTVSPEEGRQLLADPPFETCISHVGEIIAERSCHLVDQEGRRTPLAPRGWVHRF